MMENDEEEKSRAEVLGFKPQKEIIYNKLLPYCRELDEESNRLYVDIKTNLVRSVLIREIRPGCAIWTSRLMKYMKIYGFKFSKEDHIALIKLMYELLTIPDLEPTRVNKFATTLTYLLKKTYLLSPKELQLEWRPLYDLCTRIMEKSKPEIGMYRYYSSLETNLDHLIHAARIYFPPSCTQEILDEFRPHLCPFETNEMARAIEHLELFLPIAVPPEETHLGYKLWFDEFMTIWKVCHNANVWEGELMWLIARLASYTIGYIDWEPHIPIMFTRFLRSLQLPVSYKQKQSTKHHKIDTSAMAIWIVSAIDRDNSLLHHLEKFMQTLESYYHPANVGRWSQKLRELIRKLPYYFIQRVHNERVRQVRYPKNWEPKIEPEHQLTDEHIDKFVQIMLPCVKQAMFSRMGTSEVYQALQHLAALRPNIICPLAIDKMYGTLDSLTEPHKLTASMQCVIAVARQMVQGKKKGFSDGPTHVIPLLMALLPGIDPNDIRKCFVTFQFIATFTCMIPIIDSSEASKYHSDLSEEEHAVCEASAQFEDFVLQFFDRIYSWIESSSLEVTRLEQVDLDKKSKLETMAEAALSSVCASILMQTSLDIFKKALHKLYTFATSRILEIKVSGPLVATVCQCFVKIHPRETMKLFVPSLIQTINTLLASDGNSYMDEENLDNELLYNLLLISEMLDGHGYVAEYADDLINILKYTLHMRSVQANAMAGRLLTLLMCSLTTIQPREYKSSSKNYDASVKDFLSIREWGEAGKINNLKIDWYIPGSEEIACVQKLLNIFLPPEIEKLQKYTKNEIALSREEVRRSLRIIAAVLGCQTFLPQWEEPAVHLANSNLKPWAFEMTVGSHGKVTMPDGSNVRKAIADCVHDVQAKLLKDDEGNTKAILTITQIWDALLLNKFRGRGFENHWKNFHAVKKVLEDKLLGQKQHLRSLLVDRVMLHQEFRTESRSCTFTQTHKMILLDLFDLSVSHYSEVRINAQCKLFSVCCKYPYSYSVLTPKIMECLQLDTTKNHETFKGCLYVLLGPKNTPIATRHDWRFIRDIWPLLVKSMPSEKPSVISLMNQISEAIHKYFPTIAIKVNVPEVCLAAADVLSNGIPKVQGRTGIETEISIGLQKLDELAKSNYDAYCNVVDKLMELLNGNLHWRHHTIALGLIRDLVHPEVKYNQTVVKHLLQSLISDSINIRKIAIRVVTFILLQQKQKYNKIPLNVPKEVQGKVKPGYREDNEWILYNSNNLPCTEESWNSRKFVHKVYIGYYCWPKKDILVYKPSNEQPDLNRPEEVLNSEEREIYLWFQDEQNISKIVAYFSLEEKKGQDKFSAYRYLLFKCLFRNFGDTFLPQFLPHIANLVSSKEEQHQRFAAEMMAGIVKATKNWSFEKTQYLWELFIPFMKEAMTNMSVETTADWGLCFAMASDDRDPNQLYWMMEQLMNSLQLDLEGASFLECAKLYILQGVLNQSWKVNELLHRLLQYLENHLSHPFQNVREKISDALTTIFSKDLLFPNSDPQRTPRMHDFLNKVLPKLDALYELGVLNKDTNDKNCTKEVSTCLENMHLDIYKNNQDALRLFKTVCRFITCSIIRLNYSTKPDYFKLLPLACLLQNNETDDELDSVCSNFLAVLAHSMILEEHVQVALEAVEKVATNKTSWQSREVISQFLPVFIFHNMATIITKEEWISKVEIIVMKLLEDDQPEVRFQASEVLSGLLHCKFLPKPESLLGKFKLKAKSKLLRKSDATNPLVDPKHIRAIRTRHAGVLGLCSFISSHPYDVPDYLPDIFLELGSHLNDPQPIPSTIRKTLGDFKRTHHDNWEIHKLHFTEEELSVLSDLTVPPSYYA